MRPSATPAPASARGRFESSPRKERSGGLPLSSHQPRRKPARMACTANTWKKRSVETSGARPPAAAGSSVGAIKKRKRGGRGGGGPGGGGGGGRPRAAASSRSGRERGGEARRASGRATRTRRAGRPPCGRPRTRSRARAGGRRRGEGIGREQSQGIRPHRTLAERYTQTPGRHLDASGTHTDRPVPHRRARPNPQGGDGSRGTPRENGGEERKRLAGRVRARQERLRSAPERTRARVAAPQGEGPPRVPAPQGPARRGRARRATGLAREGRARIP